MCLLGVNDQTVDTVGINGFLLTTKCGFFHNLNFKIKNILYIIGKTTFANNYNDEIYLDGLSLEDKNPCHSKKVSHLWLVSQFIITTM